MSRKNKTTNKFMFLYGVNSVAERLRHKPESIQRIFLEESFADKEIQELIRKKRVSCQRVSAKALRRIKPAKGLQKIVAKVEEFQYAQLDQIVKLSGDQRPIIIFLDNIGDPQNIGVIIRTLACFGGFALVLPKKYTCGVNDTVMHVASGGENYVLISQVGNLAKTIGFVRDQGYTILGSMVGEDAEDICEVEFPFPLGVVFGSEGDGIRKVIRPFLDRQVRIPMEGAALSLNVNNACAVFCFKALMQKKGV